jgi:RNA polymerase sigma-70 factor (ECF subfamily)
VFWFFAQFGWFAADDSLSRGGLDEDFTLVERMNAGGASARTAFAEVYVRCRTFAMRVAMRYSLDENDAEDAVAMAFETFAGKFPGFVLTSRLTTFLFPIIRHHALRLRRSRLRHASTDDEALAGCLGARGEGAIATGSEHDADQLEALRKVLMVLPATQREVVVLRFVDGMSLEEVSLALEIPLGTVKSRLFNALTTLRSDPGTRRYFGITEPRPGPNGG